VDIDLKSFFDEVNHDYLMILIKRKVRDPLVLRLIWKYLRSIRQNATGGTQGETPDHTVYRKPASLTGKREEKRHSRTLQYEYLGFAFESSYQRGVRGQYQLVVSKSSWAELKYKIKQITRKTIPASFDERIERLLLLMRGWLNYFKPANIFGKLRTMDGLETVYTTGSGITGNVPEGGQLILHGLGFQVIWPGNGRIAGWVVGLFRAARFSALPLPLIA